MTHEDGLQVRHADGKARSMPSSVPIPPRGARRCLGRPSTPICPPCVRDRSVEGRLDGSSNSRLSLKTETGGEQLQLELQLSLEGGY